MVMNRRRNYRISHASNQREAMLRVAGETYYGYVVDESSGGFCFHVDGESKALAGQEGRFHLDDVESHVRIVSVRRERRGTRIGLQRLGEVPPAKPVRRPSPYGAVNWYRAHNSNFSIAVQLLVVLVAVLLVTPHALRRLAATPAARSQHRPRSLQGWVQDQARWLFRSEEEEPASGWRPRVSRHASANDQADAASELPAQDRADEQPSAPATDEPTTLGETADPASSVEEQSSLDDASHPEVSDRESAPVASESK